jgi:hypothetical protein
MTFIHTHWLKFLAIAMLAGSLLPIPYFAYYQLMNWVVVGASILLAWDYFKQKKELLMWLFIAVAVVFNPIAPFHLRIDIWQLLDIAVIGLFLLSIFLYKKQ